MRGKKVGYDVDKRILREIAEGLLGDPKDAFREMVTNAWDADAKWVRIWLRPDKILMEDNGSGIDNYKKLLRKGAAYKEKEYTRKLARPVVGEKGIGTLTYFKLGKTVEIQSKHSTGSFTLITDFDQLTQENHRLFKEKAGLDHTGTLIKIKDLRCKIPVREIEEYFAKHFAMMMAGDNFTIRLNGRKIDPRFKERGNIHLNTKYGTIEGHIRAKKEKSGIKIYNKMLFVTEWNPGVQRRPVSGEVAVNWLKPTSDRDDFVKNNPEWREFRRVITRWIRENIKPVEERIDRLTKNKLADAVESLSKSLRELNILPEGDVPVSQNHHGKKKEGKRKTIPREEKENKEEEKDTKKDNSTEEQEKKENNKKGHKPRKIHSPVLEEGEGIHANDYGFTTQIQELGEGEPPFKVEENRIILNASNPLFKEIRKRRYSKREFFTFLLTRAMEKMEGLDVKEWWEAVYRTFKDLREKRQ